MSTKFLDPQLQSKTSCMREFAAKDLIADRLATLSNLVSGA